ncbi:hypothetical protein K7432_004720 [Basidiobolus ranarum]|uniref:F-box domain-containing protein n=1 Tax=Basidiobolus ranarum TaxID=34480 RepID=A0ABR2W477_9FUNG
MTQLKWTLPAEVLQIILEYLPRPEDLFNCCLVCSTWCNIGGKLLWKSPILTRMTTSRAFPALEPIFKAPKDSVSPLVQIIDAYDCSSEILDKILTWILQLRNLRVLKLPPGHLTCWRITSNSFAFQSLRVLKHVSIEQNDLGRYFLYQLIENCPLLEDLSIQVERGTRSRKTSPDTKLSHIPKARHLRRLKLMEEFRLQPCGELKEDFLEIILLAMPSIQEFTLVTYSIPNELAATLSRVCPNITHLRIRNLHVYGNSTLDRRIAETSESVASYFKTQLTKLELDFGRVNRNSLTLMLPNSWYEHSWTHLTSLKLSGIQISPLQMVALSSSIPKTMSNLEIHLPSVETIQLLPLSSELNLDSWLSMFVKCGSSLTSLKIHSDSLPKGFAKILGKYCSKLKHLQLESPAVDEFSVNDIVRDLGGSLSTLHIHSVNLGTRTFHIIAKKCVRLEGLSLNRSCEVPSQSPYYSQENQTRLYIEDRVSHRFLQNLTKLSLVHWKLGVEFFDMLSKTSNSNLTQVHVSEPYPSVVDGSLFSTLKTKFSEFLFVD